MIRIPENKMREIKGLTYYLESKHIQNIREKYRIILDRPIIDDKYKTKKYEKS